MLEEDCLEEQKNELELLKSMFPERIKVASEAGLGSEDFFSYSVSVPVALPNEDISIETWLYVEPPGGSSSSVEPSDPTAAVSTLPPRQRPIFNRSVSGRRWHTRFRVSYLPPINLHVTLPRSYPAESQPSYTIGCMWLDKQQLTSITHELDKMWQQNQNTPIIFNWLQWLENEALGYLEIHDEVSITPEMESDSADDDDSTGRVIVELSSLEEDIFYILKYDMEQECIEFGKQRHVCVVCYCEYEGTEFFRIHECHHAVCQYCMLDYCNMHVAEGTVQLLRCPTSECDSVITPDILRIILTDDDFHRWERLMFQKALDSMSDVDWCPRCQLPVITDGGGDAAASASAKSQGHCVECQYTYCVDCKDVWHQGKCETLECDDGDEEEESEEEKCSAPPNMSAAERIRLKKKKIKQKLMNKLYLQQNTKPCPVCKSPIEKNGGCNKMTCTQCLKIMCWICSRKIEGYDHFRNNNKCALFTVINEPPPRPLPPPRPAEAARIDRLVAEQPERRERLMRCVNCKQQLLKEAKNNHIKCWNCKGHMCFLCKTRITGKLKLHYGMGKCQQHSE